MENGLIADSAWFLSRMGTSIGKSGQKEDTHQKVSVIKRNMVVASGE
jgi:hypothetical protein